jgi:ribonuclease J
MLRFIALSGTIGVTENLNVYETEKDLILLDCGIGFPDLEMPGVDLVIPDFSYVVKNKHKLKAIVLSQGHEDHIGSLPFLFRSVNAPIYCAPLVSEFVKLKFDDYGVKNYTINVFNPENTVVKIGDFAFYPFRVAHSVPDTCGFLVEHPEGRFMHVPEHKIDQKSVDGMPFDLIRARELAKRGKIDCLISDCLGANNPGFAPDSVAIEENIYKIAKDAKQAIYMTAMSSAIGRFQQMINVAGRLNRKVVLIGRSIQEKVNAAHLLGYIKFLPNQVIDYKKASKMSPSHLVYIVAGCYGQVGSSVYRIATDVDNRLTVVEGDTFVFSANPAPPYSKESQDFVIDELVDKGVDVHYYDLNEGLHVSGHGYKEDIKMLFDIAKPSCFIPTGGTIKHMHSYEKLVIETGRKKDQVFKLKPGESVEFTNGKARRGQKVRVKEVMVHGLGIGDIGKTVLEHRTLLGKEGMVVVAIKASKKGRVLSKPQIVTRGFVFEGISSGLLNDAVQRLSKYLNTLRNTDSKKLKQETIKYLEAHFYQTTGRSPMIIPIVVEV